MLLLAVAAGAVAARLGHGPWPTDLALRHEMARAGCAAARAVGLAPARIGEPGYWPHLDADHDGIACEPWWPPGDRWAREDRGPAWRP